MSSRFPRKHQDAFGQHGFEYLLRAARDAVAEGAHDPFVPAEGAPLARVDDEFLLQDGPGEGAVGPAGPGPPRGANTGVAAARSPGRRRFDDTSALSMARSAPERSVSGVAWT